jgi:cobalt-zinc-cadmium resistance protein CzcA
MLGILTLQFDGLVVPGLLLLQMPLAFSGGAIALVVSGVGLNAIGLIAFLTLIGVSLNRGIVLLQLVKRNEAEGLPVVDAVHDAVEVRFRPILLTVLTASLGLLPTALGFGKGAAPEQGLAIVTLGGLVWNGLPGTNLIPALYVYRREKQGRQVTWTRSGWNVARYYR